MPGVQRRERRVGTEAQAGGKGNEDPVSTAKCNGTTISIHLCDGKIQTSIWGHQIGEVTRSRVNLRAYAETDYREGRLEEAKMYMIVSVLHRAKPQKT